MRKCASFPLLYEILFQPLWFGKEYEYIAEENGSVRVRPVKEENIQQLIFRNQLTN